MPEETLQPDGSTALDTFISENNPTGNFGTSTQLQVGTYSDGDNLDSIFKFDLSAIEPGSKIEAATFSLKAYSDIGSGSNGFEIRRILTANEDWTETGATWNTKDGSNAWAGGAGCEEIGTDISVTPLFSGTESWNLTGWNDWDLNAQEFQALIDVGNYGFIARSPLRAATSDALVVFRSSDYGTAADRPKLYVRWIAPSRRVYEYTFNIESGKLTDSKGQVMDPVDIEVDKWVRILGLEPPLRGDYESMVEHPNYCCIVSKIYDEDRGSVRIRTDRNQFADQLISLILRGG